MKAFMLACYMIVSVCCFAQKNAAPPPDRPKIKFGEVTLEDFNRAPYSIDKDANAVVILDIGDSEFVGNSESNFNLLFMHHKRVHIINQNGFEHATVQIPLYSAPNSKRGEKIKSLVAYTYNVEGGKVVATKIEKSSVFEEKITPTYELHKFTFPNLKEGSIVEFKYVVESPFIHNLQPWDFQDVIPTLWSEYTVNIPNFFEFLILYQGYRKFDYSNSNYTNQTYRVTIADQGSYDRQSAQISARVAVNTWALKNVPALKFENYTTSLENHIQRIFFQLKTIKYNENERPIEVMSEWPTVMKELLKDNDFGGTLNAKHASFQNEIQPTLAGAKDDWEKAGLIYHHVKGRFKRTGPGSIYLKQSINKLGETKAGTPAEINLYLIAMLKNAGLRAEPVILSTRSNGIAPDMFPVISKYNYVICRLTIQDQIVYLDAAYKKMGFGKLPTHVYNGAARLVNEYPISINFAADSVVETSTTNVGIRNTGDGTILGSYSYTPGYYASSDIRSELDIKSVEEYFNELKKGLTTNVELTMSSIDGADNFNDPVSVYFEFKVKADDDVLYFNPMFTEALKENPFKSANREYPVEMSYRTVRNYVLTMDIPAGYEVDELPETEKLLLNDKDGYFEYRVTNNGKKIILVSKIILTKAFYENADYTPLRDFFAVIVKKHAEQFVFKKIK